MNDHDLLIKVSTTQELMYREMLGLRDGTKADITSLFTKAELLEKSDIDIKNALQRMSETSLERFNANGVRIGAIEKTNKDGVQRIESNKSFVWRKLFEAALPFFYLLLGGLTVWAVKNGIIH